MTQIVPANASQIAELRQAAGAFEQYAGQVSRVVAARYAWWTTLQRYGLGQYAGGELVAANQQADVAARQWATVVRSLDAGRAQLAAWAVQGELDSGQPLRLGVVVAGSIPTTMSLWPIVPIIVYAAGAAIAVGSWMLTDAWLGARQVEAETSRLHAQTQAKITSTIAQVAATQGPQAAATVADALAKANQAAAQPTRGILDQLVGGLTDLIPTSPSGIGGLALLVIGYFFLKGRGEKKGVST